MQVVKKVYHDNEAGSRFAQVEELLESGVEEGISPGMVLLVARDGNILFQRAVGSRYSKSTENKTASAVSSDTVFDIASITSLVVTATLFMRLFESGKYKLEDKAARYVQGFGVHGKSLVSLRQLLNHSSGLAGWAPYYEELLRAHSGARLGVLTSRGAREYILNSIIRSQLKYEPGTKQVYSDLGLILLGCLAETFTGLALDKAALRSVLQPLGMKSTSYIDLSMIKRRGIHPVTELIAPTEDCSWRKRILCGEVHDDNAWAMGGIAGHSGLFSTASDLNLFATEMIAAYRGQSSFLRRDTVLRFWSPADGPTENSWRLGWDGSNAENGMEDSGLSAKAVGACGFTGCSLWIEPEEGISIILMTNRIHPSRSNKKIFSFRPRLHKAVLGALRGY